MSDASKHTFVYESESDKDRIITIVLPKGSVTPNWLAIHLSDRREREEFFLDQNRTDRLNTRQIVGEEKARALREGIQGLMDSLDDSVISNEKEREGMYNALSDLFQMGYK